MLVVMVFAVGSAAALAYAALATQSGRQVVSRLIRIGAHRADRGDAGVTPRREKPPAPEPTGRVVQSCRVASDRLMDAPTGRLHPSTRHRVPPWVAKD